MVSKVTIIIPHWNGEDKLRRCLLSLQKTAGVGYGTCVVDNGSSDGSSAMVRSRFPEVRIVHSPVNVGFAAGCNLGIRLAETPYVVLLNNDAEVTPGWLSPMVDAAERDSSIGAAQPKILSLQDPHRFDYCGACGGEIDLFGYPFARGRLFDTLEIDAGQYDTGGPVFWATGAATLLRKSALEHAGLLDESFFAHMEEIDLNWRFHLSGYRVVVVPEAVVYHETGGTLGQESYQKMVLNHRNSLLMLLKNLSGSSLVWIFPIRLFLEGITFVVSFFSGRFKRALAVAAGFFGAIVCWQSVLEGRKQVKAIRIVPEFKILHQMYRGSTAILYFLFGVKRANELKLSRRTE